MGVFAIIPARGGSKRIPRKNIKTFLGKPIISYSIEKAISSQLFDKVIVSTDDDEIAKIAMRYGAEVPFVRPANLSDDYTGSSKVVAHSLNWMQQQGLRVDALCCIYATAPFIRSNDLCIAYDILKSNKWDFVFTATEFDYPVQRSFRILKNGSMEMMFPENYAKRSQDLEVYYHDVGQFYWGKPESWLEKKIVFSEKSTVIQIPSYRAVDIDSENDWKRAELLYRLLEKEGEI